MNVYNYFKYIYKKYWPGRTRRYINDKWLKHYKIKTFIDIGAYQGEYIDFARKLFPQAKIYAFEPQKKCKQILQKKKINQNIKIFNYAIGEKNTKKTFYQSSYSPASSLLPMNKINEESFLFSSTALKKKIEVKTLDSVLEKFTLYKDIFIKVDTQGFEDRVIMGGKMTFSKAKIILIEVSFKKLYKNQKLFHEIYEMLYKMGYVLAGFRNQVKSPKDGSILQAHAFFIRK